MQHNWGDKDQKRGFLDISIASEGRCSWEFIQSSSPQFIRIKLCVNGYADALNRIQEAMKAYRYQSSIIEITLTGTNLNEVNVEAVEREFMQMGVRRIRIILDKAFEKLELIPGIQDIRLPEDKWALFVTNTDTKDFNPILLEQMGRWAIQKAKIQF
jgi:hypothetical protein